MNARLARLRAACAREDAGAFLVRDTSNIRWLTGFDGVVRRGGCPRPAGHARRGRAAHRLALRAGRPRRGCGLRQRGGGGRRAHVARGLCRRARARCGGLRRRGRGRGGGAGRPRHRGCHCTGRIPPAAGGVREGRGRGECGRRGGRGRPRRRRGGRRRRGWGKTRRAQASMAPPPRALLPPRACACARRPAWCCACVP